MPTSDPPVVYDRPMVDPDTASQLAARHFGIVGSATELESERDRNFLIRSADGDRMVLKVSGREERLELLRTQHEALARIRARDPSLGIPEPRRADGGGTIVSDTIAGQTHLVSALGWIDGRPLARARPRTERQLRSLGQLLGQVAAALSGWDPPAAHRSLKWDLGRAGWIAEHLGAIPRSSDRELVRRLFSLYQERVEPAWDALPKGVIHNDANDHNVLVSGFGEASVTVGLIDFGDLLWTAQVAEPAIGAAYGMLDTGDPVAAAAAVFGGFHELRPLSDQELGVGFALIVARLCVSVVNAAVQRRSRPEHAYLTVSEAPAWRTLRRLAPVHPRLAEYRLRDGCGLEPCPASARVRRYADAQRASVQPVVAPGESRPAAIDLSVGSPMIPALTMVGDEPALSAAIGAHLAAQGARVGVGGYDEARLVYLAESYRQEGVEGPEWRTIHLGIDVFAAPGTPVRAPIAGRVHSVRLNAGPGDYGPTVIVEHAVQDADGELRFWTLYGHLDLETLRSQHRGQPIAAGGLIGRLGGPAVNGGWTPHLHFQVIADRLDRDGEFPGVAVPSARRVWTSLSPDPHPLAGMPDLRAPGAAAPAILARRRAALGANLSVAYDRPLHIVRGWMQHLYDAAGRRYLDAVNNVPHVGHSHPSVVQSASRQMAVLNTNTRYLHDSVVRYAERLTATLPEPLRVCFFVNSGSEANELALRLAWTHTGRRGTVVLDGAYHGNTATLVGLSPYKCQGPGGTGLVPFGRALPLPDLYRGPHREDESDPGERYAAYADTAIAELAGSPFGLAAFLSESVLGCGGQLVLPRGYLEAVYRRIRAAGGLAIADEVQVGFGRVGSHFWGFETQGVVPDIVVMGKPAGNGHPLGIVVTTPEIAASFANGMEFFSTFGGNPVSAAVGLAVLEVIERERLQWRALETGNRLLGLLHELALRHESIGQVRGLGLFLGVELVADRAARTPAPEIAAYLANRMRARGVLVSTDGPEHNVIKIKPPLVFGPHDAEQLALVMDQVLDEDGVRARYRGNEG
ncbi:MAG: aminotransferase class III-fold pyridoxal phosphate-dependent enzyme [Gemmatimonadales bacterium]